MIKKFNPFQFKETKRKYAVYEPELQEAIAAWLKNMAEKKNIDTSAQVWQSYPEIIINILVQWNDDFPESIPVGYVLVCYLAGLKDSGVTMEEHRELFTKFLEGKTELTQAYQSGNVHKWNEQQTEMERSIDALYKQP